MSEYSDLAGKRDYRTPLPMTGKPYQKTYWDWNRHCWRTEVCILLGAREMAPSRMPYAERKGIDRRDRMDRTDRIDTSHPSYPSPSPKRDKKPPAKTGGLRDRIHAHLRSHGPATTAEIIDAIKWPNRRSVSAAIHNDPQICQVGGLKGTGRRQPDEKAQWMLREGDHG